MTKSKTYYLVLSSIFIALTAILAQITIPVPFTVTPIFFSLSLIAVFMSGAVLPWRYAFLAQLAYVLLGLIGVPVFGHFTGGPTAVLGPTGGYLMAYPFMALAIALITKKKKSYPTTILSMLVALCICYILGTAWLMYLAKMPLQAALIAAVYPFIIPDLLKLFLSAFLSKLIKKHLSN